MPSLPHQALYDEDGNIIIPMEKGAGDRMPLPEIQGTRWQVLLLLDAIASAGRSTVTQANGELLETMRGVQMASRGLLENTRSVPSQARSALATARRILLTPHTLPPMLTRGWRPRTRWGSFALDTVRFGGTFAVIFLALFVTINGESYWQIVRAKLALGIDIQREQELQELATGKHSEHTLATAYIHTTVQDSLSVFLPPVGPPDDRLIIPKLGKNIPIIMPRIDALLAEDWKKFDQEIQTTLLNGSVHYPGSARPGQAGNFFVTAHSSYYPLVQSNYKDAFARLPELEIGDTYAVYYGGDLHSYHVIGKKEVRPTDVSVLDQPTDLRLSTLMTCVPVGTTLRRLVVIAEEIDPSTGRKLAVGERAEGEHIEPLQPLRPEVLPI